MKKPLFRAKDIEVGTVYFGRYVKRVGGVFGLARPEGRVEDLDDDIVWCGTLAPRPEQENSAKCIAPATDRFEAHLGWSNWCTAKSFAAWVRKQLKKQDQA